MAPAEVRARVAQLRSDVEAAKRDHTQANATQLGVDLIVSFLEDLAKGDEDQQEKAPESGTAPNPPGITPATPPDATGVPGEQKPAIVEGTQAGSDDSDKQAPADSAQAQGTTDTAKAAS